MSLPEVQNFLINFKRDILLRKGTSDGIVLFLSKLFSEVVKVQVDNSETAFTYDIIVTHSLGSIPRENLYREAYINYMQPAGTNFSLTTIEETGTQQTAQSVDDEIQTLLENTNLGFTAPKEQDFPAIGNYYVYPLGATLSDCGCSGSSSVNAILENTADMKTFRHPIWNIGPTSGVAFGDINIFDFVVLELDDNPNTDTTPC